MTEPSSPAEELRQAAQEKRRDAQALGAKRMRQLEVEARALADLLEHIAVEYETETDIPECPNCGEGCGGHDEVEFCVVCEDEAPCRCITKALALARAVNGTEEN